MTFDLQFARNTKNMYDFNEKFLACSVTPFSSRLTRNVTDHRFLCWIRLACAGGLYVYTAGFCDNHVLLTALSLSVISELILLQPYLSVSSQNYSCCSLLSLCHLRTNPAAALSLSVISELLLLQPYLSLSSQNYSCCSLISLCHLRTTPAAAFSLSVISELLLLQPYLSLSSQN